MNPSPSPTVSPTITTDAPTRSPTNLPSPYPTFECPCILVNSTSVDRLSGMYQLQSTLHRDHSFWINYDSLYEITWANDAVFDEYWVIGGESLYAIREQNSDDWKATPPIGERVWTVYSQEQGFVSGGTDFWLELDCTTCTPTPSPTPVPSILSTPTPTTP